MITDNDQLTTINCQLSIVNCQLITDNWIWGISSVGLEHLPCTQGVKGSSPLFSTKIRKGVGEGLGTGKGEEEEGGCEAQAKAEAKAKAKEKRRIKEEDEENEKGKQECFLVKEERGCWFNEKELIQHYKQNKKEKRKESYQR